MTRLSRGMIEMADLEAKIVMRIGVKLFFYRPLTHKTRAALLDFLPRADGFYGFTTPMDWRGLVVEEADG